MVLTKEKYRAHESHVWSRRLSAGDEIFGSHDLRSNNGYIPKGCVIGVTSTLKMVYPPNNQAVGVIVTSIDVGLEADERVRNHYTEKNELFVGNWTIGVNSTFYVSGNVWSHNTH